MTYDSENSEKPKLSKLIILKKEKQIWMFMQG